MLQVADAKDWACYPKWTRRVVKDQQCQEHNAYHVWSGLPASPFKMLDAFPADGFFDPQRTRLDCWGLRC